MNLLQKEKVKAKLIDKFSLFKAMLKEEFKEGQTGIIEIKNIDPEVIKVTQKYRFYVH